VGAAALFGVATLLAAPPSINGTKRPDLLRGTKGADVIKGLGGNDRLLGYGGRDRLYGGFGNDILVGGKGKDVISGGPGNDKIRARDGERDTISCGSGRNTVVADDLDALARDCVSNTPPPPDVTPRPGKTLVLNNEPWRCLGKVDLDLVKVTMRTNVEDALRIDQNCSGRVGRIEVDTWTADGIKVQNRGTVAHDLVIQSGYVKCHDIYGAYHQDGIHVMGGYRITFNNLRVDCLGNSNLFLTRGGSLASTPTDVVCDGCILGPNTGQTLFYAPSIRSGARNTTICTGRFRAIRIEPGAQEIVNLRNKTLPHGHPACANVTGRETSP
jgi:hypothetical protein